MPIRDREKQKQRNRRRILKNSVMLKREAEGSEKSFPFFVITLPFFAQNFTDNLTLVNECVILCRKSRKGRDCIAVEQQIQQIGYGTTNRE